MKKKTFIVLLILALALGGIFMYASDLLGKVNQVELPEEDTELGIKEEAMEIPDITNILLFGIDKPSDLGKSRSDSIMIASLDKKHSKIKLTSIMRDTYVDIPGHGMDKINHAFAFGGEELALQTVNQNFDMNIRDFVTVDFEGLEEIVDSLDGIEVDIKENEVSHVPGSIAGPQILNGKQALYYSRIRKTGNGDFERTQRQRLVLEEILRKALNTGIASYPKILNKILPFVETSLAKNEMLKLGSFTKASDIKDIEQFRIPVDGQAYDEIINGIYYLVPNTLEDNTEFLHEFIYEE